MWRVVRINMRFMEFLKNCSDVESSKNKYAVHGIFEKTTNVSISVIACDTKKVTDMGYMFFDCENLKELDIKNFNTTNVTNMEGMFSRCSSLTKLKFGINFNTENVTNMKFMFNLCKNLKELEIVKKFNTTKVSHNNGMFNNCKGNIKNKILGEDK